MEDFKNEAELKAKLRKAEEALNEGSDDLEISPEEAQILLDQMSCDLTHPYMNESAPAFARDRAVRLSYALMDIIAGKATSLKGYVDKHYEDIRKEQKEASGMSTGSGDVDGRHASNGIMPNQSESENGGMPFAPEKA